MESKGFSYYPLPYGHASVPASTPRGLIEFGTVSQKTKVPRSSSAESHETKLFVDKALFAGIVNKVMRANRRVRRILLSLLQELPGLELAHSEEDGASYQIVLRAASARAEGASYRLALLWAGEGWPSDVRVAAAAIADPWPRDLVVAARKLSPGALELLRKRNANWVDEAGNVRLQMPPALIIMKVASEQRGKREPGFSWSSSSITLAEFMLARSRDKIVLKEIAGETGWSIPQVSNVLSAFDEKGWTTRHGPPRGRGVWRELTKPGALLEAWSAHLTENRPERYLGHRLLRDPIRFLSNELAPLLTKRGDWAVTGWAALESTAAFVSVIPSLQLYLPAEQFHRDRAALFEEGKIQHLQEGGNIEFWEAEPPLLLEARSAGGLPVVNLPRLYSDLLAMGGRAREGARHLREARIGY